MNKTAQKHKNPEKEKLSNIKENLFQHKKKWNKSVGDFQKQLSNFQKELRVVKNLINGRIEGKEKLKLHQPLPEESISLLNSLKEISPPYLVNQLEEGKEIVKEQYLYAKNYDDFYSQLENKRKEKMEKKNSQIDYNLISEGVHPLKMKWESLKSVFSNPEESLRTSIAQQLFDIDQLLSQMESQLYAVKSLEDANSLDKKANQIESLMRAIATALNPNSQKYYWRDRDYYGSQSIESVDESLDDARLNKKVVLLIERDLVAAAKVYQNKNKPATFMEKYEDLRKLIKNFHSIINKKNAATPYLLSIKLKYRELVEVCTGSFPSNNNYTSFRHMLNDMGSEGKVEVDSNTEESNPLTSESSYYFTNNYYLTKEATPYDSTFNKFDKFLSKNKLRFSIFNKIKGNLLQTVEIVREIRGYVNDALNDILSAPEILDKRMIENSFIQPSIQTISNYLKPQISAIKSYLEVNQPPAKPEKKLKQISNQGLDNSSFYSKMFPKTKTPLKPMASKPVLKPKK